MPDLRRKPSLKWAALLAAASAALFLEHPFAALIGGDTPTAIVGTAAWADDDDGGGYGDDDDDDDRPAPRVRRPPPARPEIVITGLTDAAIARLRREGFLIRAQRRDGLLPGTTVRAAIPRRLSESRALARVRAIAPDALADRNSLFNQRYQVQSDRGGGGALTEPFKLLDWPRDESCTARGLIGMIDTGVDTDHPALKGRVESDTTRAKNYRPSSRDHGTAVALLIAGHGAFEGAAPAAKLVAVDAFHRRGRQDVADTFDLVAAIDLLVARKVSVINLSLAGPKNDLLDRAGQEALKRGTLIVAAAGNDGPRSPPRYPAAYPWAATITAVDGNLAVYPRAGRGDHIALAAPGMRLALPDAKLKTEYFSGTSFAAPFATAALATLREKSAETPPQELLARLKQEAKDLGEPGPDPVFGAGLLQMAGVCD